MTSQEDSIKAWQILLAWYGLVLLMALLGIALSGCTVIRLDSKDFHASRTAWFTEVEANLILTTPDGAKVEAQGLKSTINTKALEALIAGATAVKP